MPKLLEEISANVDDFISILNGTKNHTRSGTRGWDGLTVYSYGIPDLEKLEPFLLAAKSRDCHAMQDILSVDRKANIPILLSISGGYSNLLIICAEGNLVEGVAALVEELNFRKQHTENNIMINRLEMVFSCLQKVEIY